MHSDRTHISRLILLGAIAALGSLAIQAIVPGLPRLAADLQMRAAGSQLVIGVYLAGLAGGQLAWAPLSDARGRRPVILAGIALFALGTIGCALAHGLPAMLAGRALQALGASGALVAARTMAADTAPEGGAAGALAILTSVTLLSPAVSPLVGGGVIGLAGWRALFWLTGAVSLITIILAWRMLPETRADSDRPKRIGAAIRSYGPVIADRGFLGPAVANALISGGFYVFLAVSPFIFLERAHASPATAGVFYAIVAGTIILGTLAVPVIERRWPGRLTRIGGIVLAIGAVAIIVSATSAQPPIVLVAAMAIVALGTGLTAPAYLAAALERHRARTSVAASLFGATQMGVAAVVSTALVRMSPSADASLAGIGGLVLASLVIRHAGSEHRT